MKTLVQMCGDPTVDWFRIHNEDLTVRGGVYYWKKQESSKVRLGSNPGGSVMACQLLNQIVPWDKADVQGIVLDEALLSNPKDHRITTSWKQWKKFPNPGMDRFAYRIDRWQEFEPGVWNYPDGKLDGFPDLLVIQDSGLGFRHCREGWPQALTDPSPEKLPAAIIYKLGQYNESSENPLLDRIIELGLAKRTTLVTTLSDLRACSVKIGISLSWELMMEEVVDAVLNPNCPFAEAKGKGLKYGRVIVTMGASGAVIVEDRHSTLVFDRSGQEGDFVNRFPGQIMGYHTCLLGALAAVWAENPENVDWTEASRMGTILARYLHIYGYETVGIDNAYYLQFPFKEISDAYRKLKSGEAMKPRGIEKQICDLGTFTTETRSLVSRMGMESWTILEENLLRSRKNIDKAEWHQETVLDCARNIVIHGPLAALPDVPVEIFGTWSSADRQEIEGVRGVNNAMKDYLEQKNFDKPMGVAVFGSPGAGKSFAVKEIARGLGIREKAQLTYNLSQFESPDELHSAFSEIRDLNLKGILPLVFWDEFDSNCAGHPLGWLHYFLAPMQDGEYTDHGVSRPLGGGIYVFAGATRHTFEAFQAGDQTEDRAAKKPDFISRLRAYINIRGINGNPNTIEDRLFMIRRAFILRQYLETNAPQLGRSGEYAMEPGVLDAFLRVTKYNHGARSLENLIKMSTLADKRNFELSSLPPDNIIEMNVNVKEFKALTYRRYPEMLRIGLAGLCNPSSGTMEDTEDARDALIQVFDWIDAQYPDHELTFFSALAGPSERQAVQSLLNRKTTARLIAILPFSQEKYLDEFGLSDDARVDSQGSELRQEIRYWLSQKATEIIEIPAAPTKRAAYLQAGRFIAENSSLLIILCGRDEAAVNPLTESIAIHAEKLNKPVYYIRGNAEENRKAAPNIELRGGPLK